MNLNLNQLNDGNEKMYDGMHSPRAVFNEDMGKEGKFSTDLRDEHKVFIMAYLDYSKKYGLGYVINNKFYGVYFNDETLMSCDESKQYVLLTQGHLLCREPHPKAGKHTFLQGRLHAQGSGLPKKIPAAREVHRPP